MENKLHKGKVFIVAESLHILQAEILVGGLEAQLPFSGEGINIPEGLHSKPAVPLKTPSIYCCLWNLWLNGIWAFKKE